MNRSLKSLQNNANYPSLLKVLDSSLISLSIKNSRLNYVYVNDNFKKLFNLSEDFVTDFDIFLPEVAFELTQEDSLLFTSGTPSDVDRAIITKSGEQKIVNISRSILHDNGEDFIICVVQDITEKNQDKQFEAYKKVLSGTEVYEKLLNRFSNFIFSTNNKRELFSGIGKLCVDLLGLDDLSISKFNEEKQMLQQLIIVQKEEEMEYDESGSKYMSIPLNKGVSGRAARKLKTMVVDDVRLDSDYIQDKIECLSEISVPIVFKNKLIGIIDSESTSLKFYNKTIQNTLEGIAGLLAIKLNELENYKELQEKSKELQSLIKYNPSPIAILDRNGNFIEASQKWTNAFACSENANLLGGNFYDLVPNIPVRWKTKIDKALNGNSQAIQKEYYKNRDFSEWITAEVSPWYNEDNTVGGVIISATIVSDLVENQLKLSRTKEELYAARKIGKLFTWSFCPDNGEFEWNAGTISVNQFQPNEAHTLESVFEHIDKDYHSDFSRLLNKAIKDKTGFEITHPFYIGERKIWLHNRGKVVTLPNGVNKIFGTAQDITDQIDAENAYKKKNIELSKINEELDQFVYKTAHDLRAPLTNLLGLIGIMRNEEDKDLLNSYFDLQEKSIDKLDNFIQKITTYTKNTRLPITVSKIDCNILVDNILGSLMYYDKSEQVDKIVQIDSKTEFYSDLDRLEIILRNLVANAIKFSDSTKDNSKIEIQITEENDLIHITVKDNGIGISKNIESRMYDMFYRGHKSTDGSGIGLYIVKETVEKLNGSIRMKSIEKEFTEFSIYLPNLNPNKII